MTPTLKLEAVVPPTDDDGSELWATFYTFRIEADGSASFPFVSHTCAELFGFSAQEAMRDVSLMHDAVHPDDRRRFDEEGRRSLRDLQLLRWRGRIVRRDGSTCPVRITSRPARLPDGATEWHGVVVEDPASRGDAHHGPDGAVAVRQADALAMLGHDVAAPLTAILACAELALEEVNRERRQPPRDINAAAVRRCLEVVVRQSHRLEAIRGDLLILAAADADTVDARGTSVDVLAQLDAAADLASADVTVSVDCPAGLCCTVQPSHLSQMLSNLVSNAVRHARREVVLSASRVGDRVLVTVTDDGPGVPAEVVPSLFTRFSHTGAAVRPAGAGTGLGLYIVRVLARANHGTVVHTPTDSGARFTLALPAA
ncbi:PAS domain-containing sensor histidine kinase [Nocardioides renjunii]|uniref:PAS domain-containing sensor histidine kinase n=1 Tax=Nocardioides renjunii TaxID=3095075 RepID=UPI002AFDE104|nr:PAS domain-containing sensor histidine kinase [Nocardioides sp. S-34]WQQ23817.1 PAS domain-containing sensor histidine kinase [Nocardioides sp. S-34]